MYTSIGYHTFVVSKNLTKEEAGRLFKDFKRYRENTKEIYISSALKYDKDPLARHCEIKYTGSHKGIWWKMRFSSNGFFMDNDFKPCSVKAVINPKTLIGEKSYIVAADAGMLEAVRRGFDQEAEKISPILKGFDSYSLNRIDYCINFDVSELELDFQDEMPDRLPKRIMELIKCGDIPKDFTESYGEASQFYLKSRSVVINCYWKYMELVKNFPDCPDMKKSCDIIRFEVQFRYPKIHTKVAEAIRKEKQRKKMLLERMEKQEISSFPETQNETDALEDGQMRKRYMEIFRQDEVNIMKEMLSDETCTQVIYDYFTKIIKIGDYYTFDTAKRIIEAKVSKWEKAVRLTGALEMIRSYGGISKVKEAIGEKEQEDFRKSLRDLAALQINPVTIPKEWGIEYIPNPLVNYCCMRAEEQRKEKEKKETEEMVREYLKECRKKKKPYSE